MSTSRRRAATTPLQNASRAARARTPSTLASVCGDRGLVMLTSDQREVELDEEQLLYVSEFWMEPLRRTAASLVMCGCVALDTEPIGNAHTASAFLALARADGVEALARKNLVKFRRSLTRSSHVQLIHTSSLACLSSSPKSDIALGHVGHVGTGGFCGQVSTNPTRHATTRLHRCRCIWPSYEPPCAPISARCHRRRWAARCEQSSRAWPASNRN